MDTKDLFRMLQVIPCHFCAGTPDSVHTGLLPLHTLLISPTCRPMSMLISLPGKPSSHLLWKLTILSRETSLKTDHPFQFKMLPLNANLWHCSRFLFIQLQVDALFSFSFVNFYSNYICFFILFIMFFLTGKDFLNGEAQFSSYCSHRKRLPSFSAQPNRHISLLPCKLLITRVANYGSSIKIPKYLFFSSVKHFLFILSRNYHPSFIPHFLPGTYCY